MASFHWKFRLADEEDAHDFAFHPAVVHNTHLSHDQVKLIDKNCHSQHGTDLSFFSSSFFFFSFLFFHGQFSVNIKLLFHLVLVLHNASLQHALECDGFTLRGVEQFPVGPAWEFSVHSLKD